jgi:hypothetical protein
MKKSIYTTPTLRTYTINVASVLMQSAQGQGTGSNLTFMGQEESFDEYFGN